MKMPEEVTTLSRINIGIFGNPRKLSFLLVAETSHDEFFLDEPEFTANGYNSTPQDTGAYIRMRLPLARGPLDPLITAILNSHLEGRALRVYVRSMLTHLANRSMRSARPCRSMWCWSIGSLDAWPSAWVYSL